MREAGPPLQGVYICECLIADLLVALSGTVAWASFWGSAAILGAAAVWTRREATRTKRMPREWRETMRRWSVLEGELRAHRRRGKLG